jgi:hypothetical protein
MKRIIAIVVTAIFVFAMTSISLATEEKAQTAKPTENTPAEAPKSLSQEMEKPGTPGELKEEGKQDVFRELTPDEQKELEEFEKQEKREFRNLRPEDIEWGEQEKPAK